MKIPCFRCDKEIDTPDASNADYIIAPDTVDRKTGIICPDCYKPTDTVIWGVHKNPQQEPI